MQGVLAASLVARLVALGLSLRSMITRRDAPTVGLFLLCASAVGLGIWAQGERQAPPNDRVGLVTPAAGAREPSWRADAADFSLSMALLFATWVATRRHRPPRSQEHLVAVSTLAERQPPPDPAPPLPPMPVPERRLEALLASASSELICVFGPDFTCRYAVGCAAVLLGQPPDQLIGRSALDFLEPEAVSGLTDMLTRLDGRRPSPPIRVRLLRPGGEHAWAETTVQVIRDEQDGSIAEVIAVARDITESLGSEDALRSSAARLRLMADALPVMIAYVDGNRRIRFANQACADCFDRSREELWGTGLEHLVGESTRAPLETHIAAALAGQQAHFEFECVKEDEHARAIQAAFVPEVDAEGAVKGFYALMTDATERKALEAQLRQSQKMEVTGHLAGGIAHDFNNLLTAVIANLSLARAEAPAELHTLLSEALSASYRAADHVKQLLTFSRKMPPTLKRIDAGTIVNEVAAIVRNTFDRGIEIAVRQSGDLRKVLADAGQLQQVLLNLCINARDAIDEARARADAPRREALTLSASNVCVDAQRCRANLEAYLGWFIRIAVTDTGAGIDPRVKARMFEPFFTTKEVGKGTGLGLAMAYGIVKQHNGWIEVDSEVDRGTTVSVFLPAIDLPTAPEPIGGQVPFHEALTGGTETILVVDDEAQVREAARRVLQTVGYEVLAATNGQEALDLHAAREGKIDLVILDLSMPVVSGEEALRVFRARSPDLPVILSSGYPPEDHERLARELAVSAILAKPYHAAKLLALVRNVLDARSLADGPMSAI